MSVLIPAIETVYGGHRFRSRIEARWAVFFDAIQQPWMYEFEGFELDSARYLPDFYLPTQDYFVEIKGAPPDDAAYRKAEELSQASGKDVFIFWGAAGYHCDGGYPSANQSSGDGAWCFSGGGWWDNYYAWCLCESCGKFGIEFEGRSSRLCSHHSDDKAYTYDHPTLIAAYDRANSFRFQHQEPR